MFVKLIQILDLANNVSIKKLISFLLLLIGDRGQTSLTFDELGNN